MIEFGPFRYDPEARLLYRGNEEIALPMRVVAVLESFLKRPGQIVQKDDILASAWEGAFVGEDSLTQAVSQLRSALGDDPHRPRYIQTIPKRGYRLIVEVSAPLQSTAPVPRPSEGTEGQPPSFAPGASVSHYELVARIGAGAMGEVWRAEDTELQRDVAIKVVPEDLAGEAAVIERFRREALMLAAVNHPNIATIHGVEEVNGTRFIVMELLQGETLQERLERGALPLDEALEIAVQITRALKVAHDAGIVHRDLKPGNIMLAAGGQVKVLDFGLAKDARSDDRAAGIDLAALTATGLPIGTAAYMSPEQAAGKPVDNRSDIFSFGCVVFEMLAGRRPFAGDGAAEIVAAILRDEPAWDKLSANLPATVQRILHRCLEKDPDQRLHDISDARVALEEAADARTPERQRTRRSIAFRRPSRPVRLSLGLVALAVAAALIAYFLSGPPPTPSSAPSAVTFDGGLKTRPSLSPNGQLVLYEWSRDGIEDGIYIKPLGVDANTRRVSDDANAEYSPVWSGSGERIAYTRCAAPCLREGASLAIHTSGFLGGNEQKLVDVQHPLPGPWNLRITWSGNERWLAYPDRESGDRPSRIMLLDLEDDSNQPRPLTAGPVGVVGDVLNIGDTAPAFAPDGRRLAFFRKISSHGACYVWLTDIGRAPGQEEPLQAGPWPRCTGLSWMPDGEELLVTAGGYGCMSTYRFRVADGVLQQVAGMGLDDVSPSVAGGRMVFARENNVNRDIFRAPGRLADDREAPLRPIIESQTFDINHSLSSDGQRIAYESCAGGTPQVWVANIDGTDQELLTHMKYIGSAPSWSPDGKWIIFDSTDSGNQDVWAISADGADGGEPWRLTNHEGQDFGSGFSFDGNSIFISSDRDGVGWEIYSVPFPGGEAGGEVRRVTRDGGSYGFADREGRFFYYVPREAQTSIWRLSLADGVAEEILPGPIRYFPRWSLAPGGIYYEVRDADGPAIFYLDLETRQSEEVFRDGGDAIWLRVSPDEKHLTLERGTQARSSELWMIENFR